MGYIHQKEKYYNIGEIKFILNKQIKIHSNSGKNHLNQKWKMGIFDPNMSAYIVSASPLIPFLIPNATSLAHELFLSWKNLFIYGSEWHRKQLVAAQVSYSCDSSFLKTSIMLSKEPHI